MDSHTSRYAENGTSESVTELQSMPAAVRQDPTETHTMLDLNMNEGIASGHAHGQMPSPATAVDALERWNSPKKNRWRVLATFICVFARTFIQVAKLLF
jgi:hypothetical protein